MKKLTGPNIVTNQSLIKSPISPVNTVIKASKRRITHNANIINI